MRTPGSVIPGRGLALLGLGLLATTACDSHLGGLELVSGSGNARTESRDVHGFDQVVLTGIGTLVITQGDTEGLRVQADDNVLPLLRSTVSGSRLELGPKPRTSISPSTPIRFEVTAKQLRSIRVEGAAEAQAARLTAEQLALDVEGSGHVSVGQLSASALTARIEGSGGATVGGQVARQTLDVTGSGTYQGGDLASQQATVGVTGSGTCALRVQDRLDATVEGSGVVTYAGSPAVTQHVTGAGRVTRAA